MDISFHCGKCGQHILVDAAGAGTSALCPKCGQEVTIPNLSESETKQCPFCAETIKKEAVVCRFCGKDLIPKPPTVYSTAPPEKPKSSGTAKALIAIFFLLVVISYAVSECGKSGSSSSGGSSRPACEVTGFDWEHGDFDTRYLAGTVRNNCDVEIPLAVVDFNLFDKSGNQVGTAFDTIRNLQPHATWKFKAIVTKDNATRAELAGVRVKL